jgi:outer membrane receptor protein involved in Fe transport
MNLVRRRASSGGSFAAAFILSAGLATPSLAQAPVIKPVEVVATRVPKSPHDVPASVEVLTGDDLRARGATTIKDALSLAAGISIAPGGDGGPASAVPEMWGLREFDAFLLVIDNVPWGGALNPAVSTLSLRDVERIEVLRGPAPVTFGATSFVGVIHIVHKAAAETARYAEAHGGSFGSAGVAVDLPLMTSGAWKSRLTADFDKTGFKDDNTGFTRGHALWRLAKIEDKRKTWFMADVNVLNQAPASPHPREGPALSDAVPLDANHNPAGAYLKETRIVAAGGRDRPIASGATWGTTASFTHSGRSMFRGFLTDISNDPNNASGFRETIDINDAYVDTHIIWPSKSNVTMMTGADLLFANGEGKGAVFSYTAPLSGATQASVSEPNTLDRDSEDRRMFLGAYASAEWRASARVSLSAGLRLNRTSERRGDGESVSNTKASGSIGAVLSLWEQRANHVRAFANFRDTFKPAAFDFGLAENEGVLDPETSRSYEGGLKVSGMDGKFDIEASYFSMDFENLVTSTVVDNLPALINAGSTRFKGFELATAWRFAHTISARASYSAHDGKFVDFVQSFDGTPTQLGGKRFEMSAKALASAGIILSPEKGIIASASMNHTGDRYLNKRNTALVPAFTTLDAGVGYRADRWEVRVDGRNLGDKRDPISESEFGDAQYYRMPAKTILVGVVVKY